MFLLYYIIANLPSREPTVPLRPFPQLENHLGNHLGNHIGNYFNYRVNIIKGGTGEAKAEVRWLCNALQSIALNPWVLSMGFAQKP
jgi:hypothetical protein